MDKDSEDIIREERIKHEKVKVVKQGTKNYCTMCHYKTMELFDLKLKYIIESFDRGFLKNKV